MSSFELNKDNVLARNDLAYLFLTAFKDPQKALEHSQLALRKMPAAFTYSQRAVVVDTLG